VFVLWPDRSEESLSSGEGTRSQTDSRECFSQKGWKMDLEEVGVETTKEDESPSSEDTEEQVEESSVSVEE